MDTVLQPSDPRIAPHLAVLDAQPAQAEALAALEAAFAEHEQWDSLLKVYEREALRVTDVRTRADLYFAMGEVWEARLGNRPQAMRHYQLAYRADPRAQRSLAAAERIYRELNHHGMVVRLLELQLEVEEGPLEKAGLYTSLGQVLLAEIGDGRRAVECFERALALAPDHAPARAAMDEVESSRANWEEIAGELRVQAAATSDLPQRAALLLRAAELTHRQDRGAPEAEIDLRHALQIEPDSARANDLLASILDAEGRHDELTQLLHKRALATVDLELRVQLLCRIAEHAVARGDDTAAQSAYEAVLAVNPGQEDAVAAVVPGLRRRRDYDTLFALADRIQGDGASADAQRWVLREAGEAAWREKNDRERAERYLGALRTLAPADPLVRAFFRPVEKLPGEYKVQYTELGRHARAEADPGKKRELHRQAALLAEAHGSAPKEAIDSWRGVLDLDRSDTEAREHLKTLYRRNERWHALVELLKQEVEQLPAERVEEKIALYEEMADIYQSHLSMEPMVVNTLHAVLHVAPQHRATLERLSKIYERRESWGQLADILGRKADATDDGRERLELLHRSAEIWLVRLQSPEDAIRRYEQVLTLAPADAKALSALRKVYEQRRAYEPLVQVYLREIDILPTPGERLARAREVAEWAQKHLHRPARLIELWNKVLEHDEHDGKALAALAGLYEREERWQALVEILQRQIDHQGDDKRARIATMKRLGQLFADRLGREDRAMAVWEEALNQDAENAEIFKILRDRHVKAKHFEALEALYARRNKWEEYVDVLVVQAEALTDPEEKTRVYFQIADVWEERLARKDRAARVYERILEIAPSNVRAAEALRPLFEKNAEWRKLTTVEEVLAAAATEPQDRAIRHRRIAKLYEEKLRRPADAFSYTARAFADDPTEPGAITKLEQLALATGAWDETATALEKALLRAADAEQRQDLALRAARIFDERLGNPTRAIGAYEAVRAEEPLHAGAVTALGRLYESTEQWEKLLELHSVSLEASLDAPQDRAAREQLLFVIANLEENRLGRPAEAVASYERILAADPAQSQALVATARLYEAAGNHDALATTLQKQLELALGGSERAPLLERLGRLAMGPLAQPLVAVERFRQLLAEAAVPAVASEGGAPEAARSQAAEPLAAEQALETLMAQAASRQAAAALLLERYRARGAWEKSLGAFEALIDTAAEPASKVELLVELGRVQEHELRRLDDARLAYARAFREEPADERAFAELDRLSVLLDCEAALAELIAAEKDRVEPRTLRAALTLRGADLFALIERNPAAIQAYTEALLLGLRDDDARLALRALARLHEAEAAWPELRATLDRALELTQTASERKTILLRKGALLEEKLQAPAEAAQAYRDTLALDPDDENALHRLDALYQASKEWGRLAEVLASKLRLSHGPGESAALHLRLGHLLAAELNRTSEALGEFRAALEVDPDNDEAVSAIEALVEFDAELNVLAAETLAPIYERRGQNDKVQTALEALLPARPPEERVAILHRVGGMSEEAGNDERAYDSYLRALKEEPGNEETRARLGRLAERLSRWPELATTLEGELPNITRTSELLATLWTLSLAAEEKLSDTPRAIRYAKEMQSAVPDHEGAFERLAGLHARERQWTELCDLIGVREAQVNDVVEATRLAVRKGELQERELHDNEAAIASYRKASALAPDDLDVLAALERLYTATSHDEELVAVLLRRAELAADPAARRPIFFTAAELLEIALEDNGRAIELYRRVTDADASDVEALRALARLYEAEKDSEALLGVLGLLADAVSDDAERVELRFRIASLTDGALGDTAHAVELYGELLVAAPEHEKTVSALWALAEAGSERLRAARMLRPRCESRGDWAAFVRTAEIELEETEATEPRVALYRRIASVYEQELKNRDRAFAALRGALEAAPDHDETLTDLERIASEDGRYADLADVYQRTLAGVAEPAVARALGHKLGRLYDGVLAEPGLAIEEYRKVLAFEPEDREALGALDRLYAQGKHHQELTDILRREIELCEEPDEVVKLHFRLGATLADSLDDPAGAVAAFANALDYDDRHADSLAALDGLVTARREVPAVSALICPLYRRRNEWAKVSRVLEVEAEVAEAPEDKKRLFLEIAELQEERLQDWPQAFAFLARALHEAPADDQLVAELTRVTDESGSWEELAVVLEEERERVESESTRERLALQVAQIHLVRLRDPRGATARYEAIVQQNPRCVAALRALDRLHTEAQAHEPLARVLRLEAEAAGQPADEVGYLLRLAEVQERSLGDTEAAIATHRAVLEQVSDQPQAIAALTRIYTERDLPEELYGVYEQRLALSQNDAERPTLLAQLARLAGERLGRADDAIELWLDVQRLAPENQDALLALQHLYESTGRYAELAEILGRRADQAAEPAERAALLSLRGTVQTERLGHDEDAIESWQAVLQATPGDKAALLALTELYQRARRYGELGDVLETRIEHATTAGAGAATLVGLLAELAAVQGDLLMVPEAAVASWQEVLELAPDHAPALDALERLYTEQGAHERVIDILQRRAALDGGEDAQVEALFQTAEIRDRRMSQPETAAEIYEQILELRPDEPRACELLEQIYERLGNHERVAELLLGRLESMSVAWERLTLLRRIADIYLERLSRPDMAFIVLCRALREDSRDASLLAEVERLARETGNFEELVYLFEDMLGNSADSEELAAQHATLARYYADELARADLAAGHYRSILELYPDNVSALGALEALLRREGKLSELAAILRRKAELAVELHEKKNELYSLAELCEGPLAQPAEAAEALERVLGLDEAEGEALTALRRIYRRLERWPDLIRVLQRQLALTYEPEESQRLRKEIASLLDRQLGDAATAADVYREVLANDPADGEAAAQLERILTVQRRWDELVHLLGEQISFAQGPAAEIELQEKIGALWEEQLARHEQAILAYRAILRIDPRHTEALESLERLYTNAAQWDELADVLERRASAAPTDEARIPALRRLGATFERRLGDSSQAVSAYQRVLELAPDDPETLAALASIYEGSGDYRLCADMLERAARAATERRRQAELWQRAAHLSLTRLRDNERAEGALRYATGADPTYLPALATLRDLLLERGEYRRALELLEREEEQTFELARKVALRCEMGRISKEKLDNSSDAIMHYESALERAPEAVEAARPLAELYYTRGDFTRARELLELVRRQAPASEADAAAQRFRLAEATARAGDEAAALGYFQEAYDADPTHLPTLTALGALLFKRGDWERAFKVYQSIVVHHSESPDVDAVDVYYRLGVIRHRLGERRKAVHSFDKALELDSSHAPTLRELVALYEETQEWEEAVERRKQLVEAVLEPKEKLELAISVGDTYRERLGNAQRAIDAYLDALDLAPQDLTILHKLLELYTESKQWRRAIDVLEQIAAHEREPDKLGTYLYSIAVIHRDELKDTDAAIDYFNRTLDANPTRLKAFEAIDKLCTQRRDWAALAQNYRTMLGRVPEQGPAQLQLALWRGLGEIYRTRLHDFASAIPCYQKAQALQPADPQLLLILSELYEQSRDTYAQAVDAHRALLAADAERSASYHALYRLYRGLGDHDRAYWLCNLLRFRNELDQGELQYLDQVRQVAPKRPARPLDDRLWHLVLHPDQDRILGRIFALLTAGVAPTYLANPKQWGIQKKDRIETGDMQIFFSRIFQLSRGVLGVAPPEVYLKADTQGLSLINAAPVTMLVGPDMVQDRPEPELAFALAKNLSYLRPEHFLSALLAPLVDTIFYAGVRTCFPTQKLPENRNVAEIDELAKRIRKALPPTGVAQLDALLKQFYGQGRHFDAAHWLGTVEHTANRAGFVVCNDLVSADRVLQQETVAISGLTREQKRHALVEFALSDDYFSLRAGLGLAVQA